jgi:uncharacterized protein
MGAAVWYPPRAMSSPELVRITEPVLPADGATWQEKLVCLRRDLGGLHSAVVAYSGGVDSSVLLRVAHDVLGDRVIAAIGRSDSYAARELALALEQARSFGARVEIVTTGELSDAEFRANTAIRCYHCKTELYRKLRALADRVGAEAILDGTIAEDLHDWRPGRRAADERGVRSPLADHGFRKTDVRAVAAHYGLASADKPASPCLASRIPYGTAITRENLRMVEEAEELVRSLGFREFRVRHAGDVARIEVPVAVLPRLLEPGVREALIGGLKGLGYRFVTLDLEGFRSGSLNSGQVPGGALPGPSGPGRTKKRFGGN